MKRTITAIAVLTTTIGLCTLAMAQSLPRTANGGPEGGAKGPGAVPVPRHPYAGSWEGTLATDGATPSRMTIHFKVADGARQAYSGETILDGRTAVPHVNISAAPDETPKLDGPVMARRSGGNNTNA